MEDRIRDSGLAKVPLRSDPYRKESELLIDPKDQLPEMERKRKQVLVWHKVIVSLRAGAMDV